MINILNYGPLTWYVTLRFAHAPGIPGTFSLAPLLQRKPLVSDPGMHHCTCVTHVPWCMSGSLSRDGVENVPGIPGACATHNFTYLVRGPCRFEEHYQPFGIKTDKHAIMLSFVGNWERKWNFSFQNLETISLWCWLFRDSVWIGWGQRSSPSLGSFRMVFSIAQPSIVYRTCIH